MNLIELAHVNDLFSLSDHDYKQFDQRIDFYLHLETLLNRRLPFNGDILDTLNLRNLKLNRSSLKRVDHILTLVKLAEAYDIADKLMFIRALVCWEAQFSQGLEVRFLILYRLFIIMIYWSTFINYQCFSFNTIYLLINVVFFNKRCIILVLIKNIFLIF